MKNFQLDGLPYYVKATTKEVAVIVCLMNRWGVTADNLIEVERIPSNAEKVISM